MLNRKEPSWLKLHNYMNLVQDVEVSISKDRNSSQEEGYYSCCSLDQPSTSKCFASNNEYSQKKHLLSEAFKPKKFSCKSRSNSKTNLTAISLDESDSSLELYINKSYSGEIQRSDKCAKNYKTSFIEEIPKDSLSMPSNIFHKNQSNIPSLNTSNNLKTIDEFSKLVESTVIKTPKELPISDNVPKASDILPVKLSRSRSTSSQTKQTARTHQNRNISNKQMNDEFSVLCEQPCYPGSVSDAMIPELLNEELDHGALKYPNNERKVLKNWIIKRISKGRIRVEGVVVKGKFAGELWKTSAIYNRVDSVNVQTATGSIYTLTGILDEALAINSGFNQATLRAFSRGFPDNWQAIIKVNNKIKVEPCTPNKPKIDKKNDEFILDDSNVFNIKLKPNKRRKHLMNTEDISPLVEKKARQELNDNRTKLATVKKNFIRDKRKKSPSRKKKSFDKRPPTKFKDDPGAFRNGQKIDNNQTKQATEKQNSNGDKRKKISNKKKKSFEKQLPTKFEDEPDDDIKILVENLPKSSRGRKIIPRLKWWANERVNASLPYIMQREDCEITIIQPTSSVDNSFRNSFRQVKCEDISTNTERLRSIKQKKKQKTSPSRKEMTNTSKKKNPEPKIKLQAKSRGIYKRKVDFKSSSKFRRLKESLCHKKSKGLKGKKMSMLSASLPAISEEDHLSVDDIKKEPEHVNDSTIVEKNPIKKITRPRRSRESTGFYHESNFSFIIKYEYVKKSSPSNNNNVSKTKKNESLLGKRNTKDDSVLANNSKLAVKIGLKDSANTEGKIKKKEKRKNVLTNDAKINRQISKAKKNTKKTTTMNSSEIDDVLNNDTLITKSNKENVITAKKGSLKYKQQVRQLIDDHNKDYEADMFENVNCSKNTNIFESMLQTEDDTYNVCGYATPVINSTLLSMRPEVDSKTPAVHSSITPNLLKSLNRSDMDCYNHERKKWKKAANSPVNQKKKPSQTVKDKTAKVPKVIPTLSSDLFDVVEVEDKNYDEEAEGPEDYYFDE